MDNGDTLHLLVLVGSSHDAEVLASSLRNAGYAVRHKHIQGGEDLTQALEEQIWDMLITSPKVGDFTAQQALETINHVRPSGSSSRNAFNRPLRTAGSSTSVKVPLMSSAFC